ncbi:unnamed protein product, partial [Polarella glacialis]
NAASLATVWVLSSTHVAQAFFEELFGGGGGGGMQFEMGGQQRRPPASEWPAGVSDEISRPMSWLKGTEWQWNNDEWALKLDKSGDLEAPIRQCQRDNCKWTAENGKLYIALGDAGVFKLDAPKERPQNMNGQKLNGASVRNSRERLSLKFQRVFDHDAADLDKDLYESLGLPDDADDASLKKAYRELSKKYHPDKNPDEASKVKFAEVRDAYEILSNPDKKILYDTGGME